MHNYLKKIDAVVANGFVPPDGINDLRIEHDDWCQIFSYGECNCDPTTRLTSGLTVEQLVERRREAARAFNEVAKTKRN